MAKTFENKRNRVNQNLAKTGIVALENSDKSLLKSINIFDENLVAITSRKGQNHWDKTTFVGASILDLAKFHT